MEISSASEHLDVIEELKIMKTKDNQDYEMQQYLVEKEKFERMVSP